MHGWERARGELRGKVKVDIRGRATHVNSGRSARSLIEGGRSDSEGSRDGEG